MTPQQTLQGPVTVTGPGLHTNARCSVTLHPASIGHGRRAVARSDSRDPVGLNWTNRIPSVMSTTIALGPGRSLRTVEHLLASLAALDVDNVLVEIEGPEVPILDGSARPWCRRIAATGVVAQAAARTVLEVRKPVQICKDGGFVRIEPAAAFSADITYDLLPGRPVRRWAGCLDRATFLSAVQGARSFGRYEWRQLLGRPATPRRPVRPTQPVRPHGPDPALPMSAHRTLEDALDLAKRGMDAAAPVLRGARPGRATLLLGGLVLPYPRYRDEALRHVVLDMIGDLALSDAPLRGHVVAHNPSHEKTYLLVAALMSDRSAWAAAPADPVAADGGG